MNSQLPIPEQIKVHGNGRFKFSRPYTKSGNADFFDWLIIMNQGHSFKAQMVRNTMKKHMTFSALQYCDLCENVNGHYQITEKGKLYVKYHNFVREYNNFIKGE